MAEYPKSSDRGGGETLTDLPCASMIVVLERMLAALEERARPIQEEIRVVQKLLQDLRDTQFLNDRRQQRAADRQIPAPPH